MRIIAGQWKGRRLQAPAGLKTRPLPDRLKQQLFDWIGPWCDDWRVIDICAGTGSFGFEAASRGAIRVDAIDADHDAERAWRHTHRALHEPAGLSLHRGTFQTILPRLPAADVVWADPPFPWYREQPALLSTLLELASEKIDPTSEQGRLLIRGDKGTTIPALPAKLRLDRRRDYGRSWIADLRLTDSNRVTSR
jgi:16S rRNA (guanine(966)-N(2))-methyltransferase RsmD